MILKELRLIKNVTQNEIADALGVKRYTYAKWEQGRAEPCIEDLIKLSNIFGCTVDYLIGVDNDYENAKQSEPSINYEEYKIIKMYRALKMEDKNFINDVFNRLLTSEEREKLNLL